MKFSQNQVCMLHGESYFNARKTYGPDELGMPTKIAEANHCVNYNWKMEDLTDGSELLSLQQVLLNCGDSHRTIRVYAQPKDPSQTSIERNSNHMEEHPDGTKLLMMDVDDWMSTYHWWASARLQREAIHDMLRQNGLDFLCYHDVVCMLSQSAWPHGKFKCHLYYWMDDGFSMEDLRSWSTAVNERVGFKLIDGACHRAVQPDYTAKRQCSDGLKEVFSDSQRISYHKAALTSQQTVISQYIRAEIDQYQKIITAEGRDTEQTASFKGSGWEMIQQFGKGGDLNEWGFKAAARIVSEEGTKQVQANIDGYATRLHAEAWKVLVNNTGGARGDVADVKTYGVVRFKQYFTSACRKDFGGDVDRMDAIVTEAIDPDGKRGVYDEDVINAAARLQLRSPSKYASLRNALKGSDTPVGPWEKIVAKEVRRLGVTRRIAASEQLQAMDMLDEDEDVDEPLLNDEGLLNEIALIRKVASSYDLVKDGAEQVLLDRMGASPKRGTYMVIRLDRTGGLINRRADKILHDIKYFGRLQAGFENKVVNEIYGRAMDETGCSIEELTSVASIDYGRRPLRSGVHIDDTGVMWVNLGYDEKNRGFCLKCDGANLTRLTWLEALADSKLSPIWIHSTPLRGDVPTGADPFCGADLTGGIRHTPLGQWATTFFNLFHMAGVRDEINILTWAVTALVGHDTKFIMSVTGEKGAGKSTLGDILAYFIKPPTVYNNPLKYLTKLRLGAESISSENSIRESLYGVPVAVVDNIDGLAKSKQNNLCRVATGMNCRKRVLYSNFSHDYPIDTSLVLNGISDPDTQSDLGDRMLHVRLVNSGSDLRVKHEEKVYGMRDEFMAGLIAFANMVMTEMRGHTHTNRGQIRETIARMYAGAEGIKALNFSDMQDAYDRVVKHDFARTFVLFLLNGEYFGDGGYMDGSRVSYSRLLKVYQRWVEGNSGTNTDMPFVILPGGEYELFSPSMRRGKVPYTIPVDKRQLSNFIRKWITDINLLLNWSIFRTVDAREECLLQARSGNHSHVKIKLDFGVDQLII